MNAGAGLGTDLVRLLQQNGGRRLHGMIRQTQIVLMLVAMTFRVCSPIHCYLLLPVSMGALKPNGSLDSVIAAVVVIGRQFFIRLL